ncbi:hypothetical protein L1D29_19745, partial [Shewanella insulae]|uniref:hypothetical protein n=1 Tax=Shewanella insulae TaxID=2681496 RepID=UPI001EFD6728
YIKGRQVKTKENEIQVSYLNTVTTDTGNFSSAQYASYKFNIEDKGDYTEVKITSPSELKVHTGRALFVKVEHFTSSDIVIKDLQKITNELSFSIEGSQAYSGEEKSEFSVDAIYNSFKRKLGTNLILKDRNNEVYFSFNIDNTIINAKISPYRNGSVVEYEYYQSYVATSDGKVSKSMSDFNTIENKISAAIKNIVNS